MAHFAKSPKSGSGKTPKSTPKPAMPIQTKLEVGPARDRYEREADRIADRVMRTPRGTTSARPAISRLSLPSAQRAASAPTSAKKTIEEKEDKDMLVQRRADGPSMASSGTERSINNMRSAGGRPLSKSSRKRMEPGLGRNLSDVRVHNNAASHSAAKSVGAKAFTVGRDVFFGAGQHKPNTPVSYTHLTLPTILLV